MKPYKDALIKEIVSYADALCDKQISTIYIGGGTPSIFPDGYIKEILDAVFFNYKLSKNIEISIEVNPESLNEKNISEYVASGINRISIGLQAWKNDHLKMLGRNYTNDVFGNKFELIKSACITNISIDVIFGIPKQSIGDWIDTLDKVIDFAPTHISCYSLEVEEGSTYHKLLSKNKISLPSEMLNRSMYHDAIKLLKTHGYSQYEISNFCRKGYECKHNLSFWKGGEYVGIGAGSSSFVSTNVVLNNSKLSNNRKIGDNKTNARYEIVKDLEKYVMSMSNNIIPTSQFRTESVEDTVISSIILGLRLNKGIGVKEFCKQYGKDIFSCLNKQNLNKYTITGHITTQDGCLRLTDKGRDLIDMIIRGLLFDK